MLLLALVAPFIPVLASADHADCSTYSLVNTFDMGAGIKADGYGRFVLLLPGGTGIDYVVWDYPSTYHFAESLFAYQLYAETNGIPDLQRHDWECQEVPWWEADQYIY